MYPYSLNIFNLYLLKNNIDYEKAEGFLERAEQLKDGLLVCDEYLNSGNYCFLEWSERIPNLIPEQALVVTLSEEENGCRMISF